MVLPADVGSLETNCVVHTHAIPAAEFPGILWAAFPDPPDGILGGRTDSWFCAAAIWSGRSRTAWKRAFDVWKDPVSQRRNLFHAGLWRYCADLGGVARSLGVRSRDGFCLSWRSYWIFAGCIWGIFAAGDSDLDAGCASGIAPDGGRVAGATGGGNRDSWGGTDRA